jgi:hypothetical protein
VRSNLLFAILVLFSTQAFAGYGARPPKPAEPRYKCGIDDDLQKKVLNNLHFEMFTHLFNADNYLRSMINCFQKQPLLRPGQSEAMYIVDADPNSKANFTCALKREDVLKDLPKNYSDMRLDLAMSDPRIREIGETVETNLSLAKGFHYNWEPKHTFRGLVSMPVLTPKEVEDADKRWTADTDTLKLGYSKVSTFGQLLARSDSTNKMMVEFLERRDEDQKIKYMAVQRMKVRGEYFEAYFKDLTSEPLLGFIPASPKGDSTDNEMVVNALYTLLYNNCVVREMNYSPTNTWRFQAQSACKKYVSQMKALVSSRQSLANQDWLALQFSSNLNWRKAIEDGEESSLHVFGLHKKFVEDHRSRFKNDEAYTCQFDRLKDKYEILETAEAYSSFAFYLGVGAVCTAVISRIPYGGAVLAELGAPLCMFGTGLGLNTVFWFESQGDYIMRFNEIFSSAPGQQTLQDIQSLRSAQTAMALSTVFLGIGSGVPELAKALKPFAKNMDKWVKFSFARNG